MLPRFYRITFALGGLEGPLALKQVATILETLTWTHVLYLKENPRTPAIYDLLRSGVLRVEDQPTGFREEGQDDWNDIPSTLAPRPNGTRAANGPTLAAWRAAELRVRYGQHARAALLSRLESDGRVSLLAVVHRPDGAVEYPSGNQSWRVLGDPQHPDRQRITFVLDLFNPGQRVLSHATLQCMLDGLTDVDARYLRHHPETPLLYESGVRYEEEPPGQEDWQDVPTTLRLGTGDCLPISTLVLRDDYSTVPIGQVRPGDRIMADGEFTTVQESAITGIKPILAFALNNRCVLRASPEHVLFTDEDQPIRAKDVTVGTRLRAPTKAFPCLGETLIDERLTAGDGAWLMGTYIADGWHDKGAYRFAISGFDDRPKRGKIEQKERVAAIGERSGISTNWMRKSVTVNDPTLAKVMAACGSHAPIKRVTNMRWSEEQVRQLLLGLQTDCSLARSGTLTHGTTSPELAIQLRILYRMLGQSVHIVRHPQSHHRGLGTHDMYRLNVRRAPSEVADIPHVQSKARGYASTLIVKGISEHAPELCADITTEAGKFYLPECDAVVHNCDDLGPWRAAEHRALFWQNSRPMFTDQRRSDGSSLYHIKTMLPDGRVEDPSRVTGMR